MLNRLNYLTLIAAIAMTFGLEGANASNQQQNQVKTNESNKIENEKYEILKRDQVDSTDTFEIPFGDSEVEDEEEINRAEKKETFKLPPPR